MERLFDPVRDRRWQDAHGQSREADTGIDPLLDGAADAGWPDPVPERRLWPRRANARRPRQRLPAAVGGSRGPSNWRRRRHPPVIRSERVLSGSAVVVMPARAVHVTVLELFGRGIAHLGDLDGEVEALTGEGMITVDGDHVALDRGDRHHARLTALELRLELHAGLDVACRPERAARYPLDERGIARPITLGRLDPDGELLARGATIECLLEPRNDVPLPVQVGKRL